MKETWHDMLRRWSAALTEEFEQKKQKINMKRPECIQKPLMVGWMDPESAATTTRQRLEASETSGLN